ncbi:unnamed protein product [Sphenostylis stenocarpa]|uniref:Uncharacterized protein n=1 Tax=Sphenostylis stenocarpa TaxID=92480 RepID=A0AA86V8Y7_9FABA|nr:unnamed protein product [Sphenostylis stenocarpa]
MKLSTLKLLPFCSLALFYFYPFVLAAVSQPKSVNHSFHVPAIIAFGDSILDTGNNNYVETFMKANFKPYGRDFIRAKSTGRFSNGKIPSDLFVKISVITTPPPQFLFLDSCTASVYKYAGRDVFQFSTGCVPTQRTLGGGRERNCVESVNQASMVYNSKLSSSIMALNRSLPDARLVYLENYSEFSGLIHRYNQFGFEVVDKACCGIGNVEFDFICSFLSLNVCKDASKYVFWDGYHPTERTYTILVSKALKKNIDKFV